MGVGVPARVLHDWPLADPCPHVLKAADGEPFGLFTPETYPSATRCAYATAALSVKHGADPNARSNEEPRLLNCPEAIHMFRDPSGFKNAASMHPAQAV